MAPSTPRPFRPPEPTAVIDWLTLYVEPDGSLSGSVKAVRRAVWYGLRISIPATGSHHSSAGDHEDAIERQRGEVEPADAGDEEDGDDRRRVDERRPEVRLHEHEEDGHEREPDRLQHDLRVVDRPRPVGEEAGQEEHEEQLAELGRLELEEAEVDPPLRAARVTAREDEEHQEQGPT